MDGAACVRALVLAVTHYRHSRTEANAHLLLTSVQAVLGQKAALLRPPPPSPSPLPLPAECVSELVALLWHAQSPHELTLAIVSLFSLLASERDARESLHVTYDLTGGVASLVQRLQQGSEPEATPPPLLLLQALKLLQSVTYDARISYPSPSVECLLLFLAQQIQAPESELTLPCLGTMANLCRHNTSVQSYVKAMSHVKGLYRALIVSLAHSSLTVVVFSLSILAALTLHDDVGNRLFHAKNINQTFQLIFNILVNGDGTLTRTFSVDLCVDLLHCDRVAQHLCRYEHFDSCLQQILGLLQDSSVESIAKLLELLLALCSVPRLRSSVSRATLASPAAPSAAAARARRAGDGGTARRTRRTQAPAVPPPGPPGPPAALATLVRCAGRPASASDGVALLSLRLLLDVYEVATGGSLGGKSLPAMSALPAVVRRDSPPSVGYCSPADEGERFEQGGRGASEGFPAPSEPLLPMLTEALCAGAASAGEMQSAQTQRCLKLTHVLDLMMHILHPLPLMPVLLLLTPAVSSLLPLGAWGRSRRRRRRPAEAGSGMARVGAAVEAGGLATLLEEQLSHSPLSTGRPLAARSSPHYAACEAGADVLLKALELLSRLKHGLPSLEANLYKTLQDVRLVPFLVFSLASVSRERVQCGLRVLMEATQLPDFPAITLGESIAASNSQFEGSAPVLPASPAHTHHHQHRHAHPANHAHLSRHGRMKPTPDPDTVQQLIDKIRSGMEITDVVRDVKTSEIIDVYEQKLSSLATKEQHLSDLLEAKSMALVQADRLLTQHRSHRDQSEAEARRLASMLSHAERRVEELSGRLSEQGQEAERAREDMDALLQHNRRMQAAEEKHARLTATHADLQHRLEVSERHLLKAQEEQRSLTELAEVLRRHNDNLKQSNDKTLCQLGEMEEQCKETRKLLQERDGKITGLQQRLALVQGQAERAAAEVTEREEALEVLRRELSRTEQQRKELSIKASSLEVHKRSLESRLEERDSRLREQQEQLSKHASMIAAIHSLSGGGAKAPTFSL
ncbi:protein CIP2A [Petromyzon marinus]|uniref:protein CIP2A n=1 Tax=Petromyzon marinus TaxID=7757 RepID=UPI003F711471